MQDVYTIAAPENPLPLVFDSPHSGALYPANFAPACPPEELRRTEDMFVDDLFASAPDHGASLLCALFPRCYIDVNRAADDIDPALLAEPWPWETNPSARSDAGIGLIRRLVRPGVPVYDRPLPASEIASRIEHYYLPYHSALEQLIEEAHYNFGQVWHINCHSMPSSSARPKRAATLLGHAPRASDFVLGDRDGTTCGKDFTHGLRDFLKGLGYQVTINDPFKGVELVERYSCPARGRHSVQLEINKALYMDERRQVKGLNYDAFRRDIDSLIAFCADYAGRQLTDLAAD